jgi:hypothetical protein
MQGDVEAHRQKVRLQLCATTATSHSGKAFWSDSVQLDALGGAAVVEAPCPMTGGTPSQKEAQAGYRLAVTAVQVCHVTLFASSWTAQYQFVILASMIHAASAPVRLYVALNTFAFRQQQCMHLGNQVEVSFRAVCASSNATLCILLLTLLSALHADS